MTLSSRVRKFALTSHVVLSVGWLGAVAGFLALAIAGLKSAEVERARAAYLGMEMLAWYVIVPLSLASLLSGVVQSLGTPWGLFRHYWVLAKLLLTVVATLLLLVHTRPIDLMANAAAEATFSISDLHRLRVQLVADAAAALLVLIVTTTLSVYKPWGLTPYGRRQHLERGQEAMPIVGSSAASAQNRARSKARAGLVDGEAADRVPSNAWRRYAIVGVVGVVLLHVVLHLATGALPHH